MLQIQRLEHFNKVVEFAGKTGQLCQLFEKLSYLDSYGREGKTRCLLGYDFAPYSFSFLMEKEHEAGTYERYFNGGLIYHGSHDGFGSGEAPSFSVHLGGGQGWQIHT